MKYYFCTDEKNKKIYTPQPSKDRFTELIERGDVVSTVDVLIQTEITETGNEFGFKKPAHLAEMKIFTKNQVFYLFDGEETYQIPIGKAIGIRKIHQGIPVVGWNKNVSPVSKDFREDGILLCKEECIGFRFFYALEIVQFQETYRLLFPAYELNKFRNLTHLKLLPQKNESRSERICPKYYWDIPKDAKYFFLHQSDVEFKTRHPVGFIVLLVVGLIVLFLPVALFLFFEALFFPPENQGPMTAIGAIIGWIGASIMGVGLFNLVAAWLQQYLGHWITIAGFLVGGTIVAVSFWIQFAM